MALGASAAAAYLDAKYHISKDVTTIRQQNRLMKLVQAKAQQNKQSLWYDFEQQALKLQDQPCIWYRTEPTEPPTIYTWTETYRTVNRFAHFLLENGVRPGDFIGTYLQNSPEHMHGLLGSWAIGSAPAWINYNLGGEGLLHCLKVAGCKVLLVDAEEGCQQRIQDVAEKIEELGMRVIVLDEETKARITACSPERLRDDYRGGVTGDFPAFLFYTSGTTGFPKACPLPTARALWFGEPRLRTTGLKPGDVWYDCMPLYHGTGGTTAICCMVTGVTLAIGRKFSVRNFWKDVQDSNANAFVYVGETARYLLAAPPSPLDKDHKLKAMYGNGMRPDVWLKFQERFGVPTVNEFFNSTEGMLTLLNNCRGPFHVAHVGHHGAILRWRLRNVLVPVAIDHEKGDAIWRDPQTGFAKRNSYEEGGEILVACQSEKAFCGYWNNPEATAKRFERDVLRKGDLYYRTGDALRRDTDGRWFFLDRLGDTFRWKSENVSTAQVAEVLGRFPGVVEANVYGVEVPGHDGKAGCAAIFIKAEERGNFDYSGLLAHARKGLPRYAVPVFLRVIRKPTPMHNNKQNKAPLRKEGVDPQKIAQGDAGREDVVYWTKPAANTYQSFSQSDWNALVAGKVRL
ncbi:very long-chain acyl- synthetase fatty acid transporter like [Lecanosticta acicola]|uniref:Very long-chain fatty acid transport protein n=1 Tax=Lecanosticta acicola TaxID=111012 RepID=A0AAI8Z321_9PEZI|nr:very long-chain acyl- synthetase fatty acid transporter like [Lecanosticta acicola]